MLTDEQMRDVLKNTNHMVRNSMHGPFWPELEGACRAIESAATEPMLQRIAELARQLEEARKDAERWAHACKGNNKQINVCSWDNDAYEFVGYAMKKEAIDAIADAEIAAMKGTP